MNKLQRFHAAVRGEPVDYVPTVAWCNFATDAVDGAENARRQLAFQEACDWDLCKVMNDYRLAPPAGIETIETPADMLRFARQSMSERIFAEQLECLRIMRARLGPEIPLIDTLFEPFFSLLFAVGFSRAPFIRSHRAEAASMLGALTDTFADYVAELRKVPVDGILYATNACILAPSSRGISDAEYREFHRPYDLRLLNAMEGLVRIVHAHGNPLDLTRILDYPCEVLSWSDRLAGNPSIAAVRKLTGKCLMGGVDESKLQEKSLPVQAQKPGGTLVWGTTQVPRHLNPAVQSGVATMMPGAQLFASPLRFDDKWNAQPYLAESWSFQDDGKSLLLKIVPNAVFHDGKPVTSEDVAFSIMSIKANHPFSTMLAAVERVDTPSPNVAVIRMSQPHPAILYALSPPLCPIIPKHIYGDGADLKTHPRNANPVGSGPYKFVEFKPGEHIILEKNAAFFIKDRPKFDRIIFRIFRDANALAIAVERKEVEFTPFWADLSLLDRVSKAPGISVTDKGGEAIGPLNWLAFNTKKKPLDDARVRQAISYAVDRDFITKKLHGGRTKISTGPIAPGSPFYTAAVEPYKTDLDKANKLLDAAGLKRGAGGMRAALSIDYLPGSAEQQKNIAEYMKPQLKKIGIDLTVRASPDFPTWSKRVSGQEFDLTLDSVFNWGDPVIGVHRTYLTSNIRPGVIWSNTQSYSNPKVDELLAKAGVEKDLAKRKALYQEFQKIVVSDAPIAFLNVLPYFQVYEKSLRKLPTSVWGATSPIDEMYRE